MAVDSGRAIPQSAGTRGIGALGKGFGGDQVKRNMPGQVGRFIVGEDGQDGRDFCGPGADVGVGALGGPGAQVGRSRKRWSALAQIKFHFAGEAKMRAACVTGMGEGMLQQGEQDVSGHRPDPGKAQMAQKPAGGRQSQRSSGGIVGHDAPAVECGDNAAGQGAVGGHKGNGDGVFDGFAQDERDCDGFLTLGLRLDQGQIGGGVRQIGQSSAFDKPLIGDRSGAQGKRDEPVAVRCGRRKFAPWPKVGGRQG